jgi:hypothetical protein
MIFTNGDSFTYGDELDKPYSEAWPYILSQMLDLDVVNFGENGKDNTGILESTKEYHSKVARLPKVWIIQWTTFRRFHDNPPIDVVLKKLDKQYLLDLYFIQVKDLQEWFEEHDFPYLMFNGFDNQEYIPYNDSEFKSLVDDKYFVGWPDEAVVNWVWKYKHGPDRHPLAEAHKRIAEILYENIRHKLRLP